MKREELKNIRLDVFYNDKMVDYGNFEELIKNDMLKEFSFTAVGELMELCESTKEELEEFFGTKMEDENDILVYGLADNGESYYFDLDICNKNDFIWHLDSIAQWIYDGHMKIEIHED